MVTLLWVEQKTECACWKQTIQQRSYLYKREREREREISMCSKKKVKDDVKGVKGEKSTQEYRF